MTICQFCLHPTRTGRTHHLACARRLFDTATIPTLNLTQSEIYTQAAVMAGKMSISGVQAKVSLTLSAARPEFVIAPTGGRYILKPEPAGYPDLPQNEHLTMQLAALLGIETPPNGLLTLADGTPAYLVKRFDRRADGTKLPVEDFCQLAGLPAGRKYDATAEQCVQLLQRFTTEPVVEIHKFFRLLLFNWWVANGDLHLKNLALLTTPDGHHRLSPAYDLINTRLALPDDDTLALSIQGKKSALTRKTWLAFGAYCALPPKAVTALLDEPRAALATSLHLIQNTTLPEAKKNVYTQILTHHTNLMHPPLPPSPNS
jgi:serine/threonine-protein kinase HipA